MTRRRVLLDTNILLDVLMDRPGLADESEATTKRCGDLNVGMWVAWHGLATAYYLLRRGRTESETMQDIDQILAWAKVATVSNAEARRARGLGFSDFEDTMQVVSAEACRADWLLTRNLSDFRNSPVPAISPAEFLVRFSMSG